MIDPRTRKTLEQVDAGLRREGMEGSVFLMASGGVTAFASTTWRAHNCRCNIGRRPLLNRLRDALGDEHADMEGWFARLATMRPAGLPRPATIWNTPHLVVTEAMSPYRLVTMFEHPDSWGPEQLREVAEQIGVYGMDDLERLMRRATNRELPEPARRHCARLLA